MNEQSVEPLRKVLKDIIWESYSVGYDNGQESREPLHEEAKIGQALQAFALFLEELKEQAETLQRQTSGKPYATGGFKGLSNIYHEDVEAIPIEKLHALMEGLRDGQPSR